MLTNSPGAKVVYIAPLKALARERLVDWQRKLGGGGKAVTKGGSQSHPTGSDCDADELYRQPHSSSYFYDCSCLWLWHVMRYDAGLGLRILELTGDVNPSMEELNRADILIVTPEVDGLTTL